jgi:hypothetical protein
LFLARLQGRPELVPSEVAEERLERQQRNGDWTQRARTLVHLDRRVEAAEDYVRGVLNSLEHGRVFGAAYYLKELVSEGLIDTLFEAALDRATEEGDLWWQIRSLQELGWKDELRQRVLQHADDIRNGGQILLLEQLATAEGDHVSANRLRVAMLTGDLDSAPSANKPE